MVLSKSDLCAIHLAAECEFSVKFVNHQSRLLLSIEGNKNDAIKIENELTTIEFERGQFLSEADQMRVKAAFDAYPNTMPQLTAAARCKAYRSDADFTKKPMDFLDEELNAVQATRSVARVLQKHIALLISQSKFDEATQ